MQLRISREARLFLTMARAPRFMLFLFFGGALVAGLLIWGLVLFSNQPERWFVPGPLGHERGHAIQQVSGRAFLTRAMSGVDRQDGGEWVRKNNLTSAFAFSEALARVFPASIFKLHPEYFPLVEGQRLQPTYGGSIFWNPDLGRKDVAIYAADSAREYFRLNPREQSFALGINDGLVFGESPETMALVSPTKWFRERPDYSPLVFSFMNRAAAELSKTHPNKLLGSLAYYWAENTPPFPLHPQVVPFLTADRAQGYDDNFRKEESLLQMRWARSGATRLGLYDYLEGSGFLIPRIYTQLLSENLKNSRRQGFTDYYGEAHSNWGLDGPMPWLAARLLEDPEQSRDSLLSEYYSRYFREAGAPMRQFFEECERRWMGQDGPPYWLKHYRNESQVTIFPSRECQVLRGLLDAAGSLVKTEIVSARVKLVSDAFGVTERFVAFEEARVRLSQKILKGSRTWESIAMDLREYQIARKNFIHYTVVLLHENPLALQQFGWDDYLKNDPLSGALRKIYECAVANNEIADAAAEVSHWLDPQVNALWNAFFKDDLEHGRDLQRNGSMSGVLQARRKIAGLDYGVDLPADWISRAEPAQFFRGNRIKFGEAEGLRLVGGKDVSVFQWNPTGHGLHLARVTVRGHVSPGAIVSLMFGWLDKAERNMGFKTFRLPDGDWPNMVRLELMGIPPPDARWVGIGLRVQNQVSGDWVEAGDFLVRASK